jgi:short-subunit dehydrogenase
MKKPSALIQATISTPAFALAVIGAAFLTSKGARVWEAGLIAACLAAIAQCVKGVLEPVWYFKFRPRTSFEEYRGDWAIVTGASRGLGRGYALALARRGLHVILLARSKEKLDAVASECEALGVRAHVIVADFAEDPRRLHRKIHDELSGLGGSISVLVNNVGGKVPADLPCVPMPCYCESFDHATYDSFFRFNAMPAVLMTQMLLPIMVQRDKGYVLNVSSMNGMQACPYLGPYVTAKAYVSTYAACLDSELRGRGSRVRVDAVCPGPVATAGIGRSGLASSGVPDPLAFAERSLSLAKSAFAGVPWPSHWWMVQSLGPRSNFLSRKATAARLYASMDYSKILGPTA